MKLNNLDIYNFRNYEKLSLNFDNNINIFIGNNGIGKTNLLESIYFLAVTKSHRSYIDSNLIKNDKFSIADLADHIKQLSKSCLVILNTIADSKLLYAEFDDENVIDEWLSDATVDVRKEYIMNNEFNIASA